VLLDTNILLRATQRQDQAHALVVQALEKLAQSGYRVCICNQNIFEYWVVVTRPVAANGYGLMAGAARSLLESLVSGYELEPDPPNLRDLWLDLCDRHAVLGVKAHDARLVSLMAGRGVEHILTLNVADFGRYPGIQPLTPQAVLDAGFPPASASSA
jgi:predicted nucleic acid-binding protein